MRGSFRLLFTAQCKRNEGINIFQVGFISIDEEDTG